MHSNLRLDCIPTAEDGSAVVELSLGMRRHGEVKLFDGNVSRWIGAVLDLTLGTHRVG